QSSNIEDRRGAGGFGGLGRMGGGGRIGGGRIPTGLPRRAGGGGLGIGTIVIILIVAWFLGINPLSLLGLGGGSGIQIGPQPGSQSGEMGAPADDPGQ